MTNWGVPMLQDQYSEGTLTPDDMITVVIPATDPALLFVARQIVYDEILSIGHIVPMTDDSGDFGSYSVMIVSPTGVRPVKGFRQAMERLADFALFPVPVRWSFGPRHTTVAHADAGEVL